MRKLGSFLAVMIAMMVIFPSLAQAEFYLGGYLGPSFSSNVDPNFEWHTRGPTGERFVYATRQARGVTVNPALLLGAKVGYWFARDSYLGVGMPSWLKYFGFEIDISYQNLSWPRQAVPITSINTKQYLQMDGNALTVAFLLLARYGFYPDPEVPFGRLQPYVGIGPAVVITNTYLNLGRDFRSTEGDLGLAVETGVRYMIRPKVSLYAGFRYRYLPTHVDVDDKIFDLSRQYIAMRTTYSMYSLIFGAAYHF